MRANSGPFTIRDSSRGVASRPLAVHLLGIDMASPLGLGLMHKLDGSAVINSASQSARPAATWGRFITGTALQWWADPGQQCARGAVTAPDLVIDLHGADTLPPGRILRVVDAAGRCAVSPFFGLDACYYPSGTVPIFLIEREQAGSSWMAREVVHLSSRQNYRGLLRGVGAAVPALIAAGLHSPSSGQAWHPGRPRSLPAALLRYPMVHLAALCRTYLTSEVWAVGVLETDLGQLLAGGSLSPKHWIRVPEQEGYIADPFAWPGRPGVILCERYHHSTGRGSLQALTIVGDRVERAEDVPLEIDDHLSYPFTFAEDGRVFCLPEMGASRRQILYELQDGKRPRPIAVVAENRAMADPTLFRHAGFVLHFVH